MANSKHKTKGKRHHVHAASLDKIANAIDDQAASDSANFLTPVEMFKTLAAVFRAEARRVQKILR